MTSTPVSLRYFQDWGIIGKIRNDLYDVVAAVVAAAVDVLVFRFRLLPGIVFTSGFYFPSVSGVKNPVVVRLNLLLLPVKDEHHLNWVLENKSLNVNSSSAVALGVTEYPNTYQFLL
jgi:hypothetical protein